MSIQSDQEQLVLELTNRARLDPAAEAERLGIALNEGLAPGTITATAKQPLAMNDALVAAARGHSQAMIDQDFFAHVNPNTGKGPQQRRATRVIPAMWARTLRFAAAPAP
jgi:hypothetical protein